MKYKKVGLHLVSFFHGIFLNIYFLLYFTKVSICDGSEIDIQPPPLVHHHRGFKCWDHVLPGIPNCAEMPGPFEGDGP